MLSRKCLRAANATITILNSLEAAVQKFSEHVSTLSKRRHHPFASSLHVCWTPVFEFRVYLRHINRYLPRGFLSLSRPYPCPMAHSFNALTDGPGGPFRGALSTYEIIGNTKDRVLVLSPSARPPHPSNFPPTPWAFGRPPYPTAFRPSAPQPRRRGPVRLVVTQPLVLRSSPSYRLEKGHQQGTAENANWRPELTGSTYSTKHQRQRSIWWCATVALPKGKVGLRWWSHRGGRGYDQRARHSRPTST